MAGGSLFAFPGGESKKGRRRPTLARAGPALPSAMGRLTSVFEMGTGISAPPWPPAPEILAPGRGKGTKGNHDPRALQRGGTSSRWEVVILRNRLSRTPG